MSRKLNKEEAQKMIAKRWGKAFSGRVLPNKEILLRISGQTYTITIDKLANLLSSVV